MTFFIGGCLPLSYQALWGTIPFWVLTETLLVGGALALAIETCRRLRRRYHRALTWLLLPVLWLMWAVLVRLVYLTVLQIA